MDKGTAPTVRLNSLLAVAAVGPALSVTVTVKVYVPSAVGVPVSVPLLLNNKPDGKEEPSATAKVYAPVPPVATKVWLYVVPTVAFGKGLVVVMDKGAAPTVSLNSLLAVAAVGPALSVAVTVKVYVPVTVGVPSSLPLFRAIPAGRAPLVTPKLYGAVPPVAVNGWLYAVPLTASGKGLAVVMDSRLATTFTVKLWLLSPAWMRNATGPAKELPIRTMNRPCPSEV